MVFAIRGATTVERDSKDEIISCTQELLNEIIFRNNLKKEEIVFILFTMTKDLKSAFPAYAARLMGFVDIPLICAQELDIEGALNRCIRLLMLIQRDNGFTPKHVYLKEAAKLREDLAFGKGEDL
ncbi:chorismate mutase [Anaerocellum diazotrophicum]|uniref:chorismate mutase n=1 Tax=Caldicellulosiruptor diazotrophicus TaxID=2806205 RepID=A0ABN6E6Z9_9FIRM|nr:chorismate mutase [Caldicellulosiruptor diazotrophicus]BCS81222.1 chorismate mutase [Caldicellulosiruptor diazotrophicus]